MNQQELRKEAAEKKYPMLKTMPNSAKITVANQRAAFKEGAEWEAEREKSVSVDQAKEYTYQWLLNKGLHDLGSYLSFDDVFHLLADFANTNPTKNK